MKPAISYFLILISSVEKFMTTYNMLAVTTEPVLDNIGMHVKLGYSFPNKSIK